MLKTCRFRPNPTWWILRCGLKTIWGNFQTDSYFWKKQNYWVSKKATTTNLNRNHMAYSTQSARSVSYRFFFRSCASSWFSSLGTVNSLRRAVFLESDCATMPGHFSAWIMWTGNCRDVFRSAETFQSPAPFSSFILGFFCFLTGHSPSLRNWIMGSLAVTGCWFAVSHYALNNSMTISNTLLCRHVYIWSDCGHIDSTWRKVPRSLSPSF